MKAFSLQLRNVTVWSVWLFCRSVAKCWACSIEPVSHLDLLLCCKNTWHHCVSLVNVLLKSTPKYRVAKGIWARFETVHVQASPYRVWVCVIGPREPCSDQITCQGLTSPTPQPTKHRGQVRSFPSFFFQFSKKVRTIWSKGAQCLPLVLATITACWCYTLATGANTHTHTYSTSVWNTAVSGVFVSSGS